MSLVWSIANNKECPASMKGSGTQIDIVFEFECNDIEAYFLRSRLDYLEKLEEISILPPEQRNARLKALNYEYSEVNTRKRLIRLLQEIDLP